MTTEEKVVCETEGCDNLTEYDADDSSLARNNEIGGGVIAVCGNCFGEVWREFHRDAHVEDIFGG